MAATLEEAQRALERAEQDRTTVREMRPKTQENVKRAEGLLAENHLAARIRRGWAS